MQKRWWVGGLGLAVVVGVSTVVLLKAPGASVAAASKDAKADGKKDAKDAAKPGKPEEGLGLLEFQASEVVSPVMAGLSSVLELSGPLVAPQTAVVRAKAAGTLLALSVGEGSAVQAGQALGTVDLAEMNSRVAERVALADSARAQLDQAQRTYASNEGLAKQNFISPSALDASRAALEAARAQHLAAQAQLATSRTSLRDAALVSPIAGVIAKRHAVPGEKLSPEQQVFTVVDVRQLELAATVGTHEVSQLKKGMPVDVSIEGLTAPVHGQIARIAPAAEPGTRAIGVTVVIDNAAGSLRAGQYAIARVVLADDTQRLTVPASAIGSNGGQDHVWVIEGGVLARRAVTTGRREERTGRVEVLQGLTAQAQVLGARFDNLREGTKAVVLAAGATRTTAPLATTNPAVLASR